MGDFRAKAEAELVRLAAAQHCVVSVAQLRSLGFSKHTVAARVRAKRLHRVHQGVYAVGHAALSEHGRYMAAVLACGDGAVLSHGSAAALWELLRPEPKQPIHVSLPSLGGRRRRNGIVIHRTSFEPWELTRRVNIPVTSPSRTILDLRRTHAPHLVRRATRQAQLAKYRLDPRLKADRTRSDVDFLWRSRRLVAETDSYEYHQGTVAFEDDHERDLALRRRGLTVLRYTGRQLEREGGLIAAEIRELLGA